MNMSVMFVRIGVSDEQKLNNLKHIIDFSNIDIIRISYVLDCFQRLVFRTFSRTKRDLYVLNVLT